MRHDSDAATIAGRSEPADRPRLGHHLSQSAAPIVLIGFVLALVVVGNLMAPGFAAPGNLAQLLKLAAFMGIVAIGQTLVMLTGGIDLSLAWVLTAAALVFTDVSQGQNAGLLPALAAALAVGGAVGAINGFAVAKLRISPIVMTLAMNNIMQGVALVYSDGTPRGGVPEAMRTLTTGAIGPLPTMVLLWAAATILVMLVLRCTRAGRALLAVGENPRVAWLSGIGNTRVIILAYTASGLCAALAGVLFAGFSGQAFLGMGDPFVLPTSVAVVLGGTSILGGRGGDGGTAIAVIFITLLTTVLIIENISPGIRNIVFGGVVIVALFFYRFLQNSGRSAS